MGVEVRRWVEAIFQPCCPGKPPGSPGSWVVEGWGAAGVGTEVLAVVLAEDVICSWVRLWAGLT